RRQVLDGEDMKENIRSMLRNFVESNVKSHVGERGILDAAAFQEATAPFRGLFLAHQEMQLSDSDLARQTADSLTEQLLEKAYSIYDAREREYGEAIMRELERVVMLRVVDEYWMDHIDAMNELKQGIVLRAYAQTNPVVEYRREGYDMFEAMVTAIQEETVRRILRTRVQTGEVRRERVARITGESGGGDGTVKKAPVKKAIKIGRNDPCPCGSGLKWKKCTCAAYHSDLGAPSQG
ncbi:MAG: Protein export cytoplasm protein SecA ATPase helicase, partial [Firmicutes bacterium]|nr:Protein export cytoplasm protein SecA ATPase helicase [Bacillota bacterium]